jgi:[ribosomal protein S5]-alanine N-acetyltransferase
LTGTTADARSASGWSPPHADAAWAPGAVSRTISWGFDALDLLRIEMTTTPDNAAVAALARHLGFTQEGVIRRRNIERGKRVDIVFFGVLREEWTDADQ